MALLAVVLAETLRSRSTRVCLITFAMRMSAPSAPTPTRTPAAPYGLCTGAGVSDRMFLRAAHCINARSAETDCPKRIP